MAVLTVSPGLLLVLVLGILHDRLDGLPVRDAGFGKIHVHVVFKFKAFGYN